MSPVKSTSASDRVVQLGGQVGAHPRSTASAARDKASPGDQDRPIGQQRCGKKNPKRPAVMSPVGANVPVIGSYNSADRQQ